MYLYYAIRTSGWQFTIVENEQMGIDYDTAIALDSSGLPRISYYAFGHGTLLKQPRYAWFDGSSWHHQVVDSQGDVGRYSSLVIDASDQAAISYYGEDGLLKYAVQQ
jgi:hypothetical protein